MSDKLTIEIDFLKVMAGAQTSVEEGILHECAQQILQAMSMGSDYQIRQSVNDTVARELDKRLIGIAAAKVEEIVASKYGQASFGSEPGTMADYIRKSVETVLTERVDREGKASRDGFNSHQTRLNWMVSTTVADLIRTELGKAVTEAKASLKKQIEAAFAGQIAAKLAEVKET